MKLLLLACFCLITLDCLSVFIVKISALFAKKIGAQVAFIAVVSIFSDLLSIHCPLWTKGVYIHNDVYSIAFSIEV